MFQKDKLLLYLIMQATFFGTNTLLLAVSDVKVKFSVAFKRMNIFDLYFKCDTKQYAVFVCFLQIVG